jgi:dihydropteroate synthase
VELQLGPHRIDTTARAGIMGILNVSRDSPIADSRVDPAAALERARELRRQGADIIDVGAHSTSSRAAEVSAQEEIERVCPVIEAIAADGMAVSVDTWTSEVAHAAAVAGVHLLNDVTGFRDPEMIAVAAEYQLPAVIMHMRGRPQRHYEVYQQYDDVNAEVRDFLLDRAQALEAAGAGTPWLDPGFEFAKSLDDNLRMLGDLPNLVATGYPVLVSASRKGFLAEALGYEKRQDVPGLLEATLAFHTLAAALGAHVVRVHDIELHAHALKLVARAKPYLPFGSE